MNDANNYCVLSYRSMNKSAEYREYCHMQRYKNLGQARRAAIKYGKDGSDVLLVQRASAQEQLPEYLCIGSWETEEFWGGESWNEHRHRVWAAKAGELEALVKRVPKSGPGRAKLEHIVVGKEVPCWDLESVMEVLG